MTDYIIPMKIGEAVYCIIDGEVKKRICKDYSFNGTDFTIITENEEDCVYLLDAFNTKIEAIKENKNRLIDC